MSTFFMSIKMKIFIHISSKTCKFQENIWKIYFYKLFKNPSPVINIITESSRIKFKTSEIK